MFGMALVVLLLLCFFVRCVRAHSGFLGAVLGTRAVKLKREDEAGSIELREEGDAI